MGNFSWIFWNIIAIKSKMEGFLMIENFLEIFLTFNVVHGSGFAVYLATEY